MKSLAISIFKSQALQIIDRIASTDETIIITKRGKPVAKIGPIKDQGRKPLAGTLASTLLGEKDLLTPLGDDQWNAAR